MPNQYIPECRRIDRLSMIVLKKYNTKIGYLDLQHRTIVLYLLCGCHAEFLCYP